ncbi:MAG: hypothetical protein J6J33_05770 [Clostridia bacterium]|nr:hypothetical protein [Clostridia bacterium]
MSLNETGVFSTNASKVGGAKQNLALFLAGKPDTFIAFDRRKGTGSEVLMVNGFYKNSLVQLNFEKGLDHSITRGAAQGVANISISSKTKDELTRIMNGDCSDKEAMMISCEDAFSKLPNLGKNAILGEKGLLKQVEEKMAPILEFFENIPALEQLKTAIISAYTDFVNGEKKNGMRTPEAQA